MRKTTGKKDAVSTRCCCKKVGKVGGRQAKSVLYAKKASLGVPIPSLAVAKFLLSQALNSVHCNFLFHYRLGIEQKHSPSSS